MHYTYDTLDRLTELRYNTGTGTAAYRYIYDDLNQLVRINDVAGGKTYTYTYDNRGNLRQKNEYALSTGKLGTPTRTVDYGYGNADWQDQLTSYNGSTITYDAIGNPTIWYNGMQITWQKGRQLTDLYKTNTGSILSYTYDDSGLRTSKAINGVKTEYYRSGSRLIGQKQGSNVMQFLYDANGLYGFLYNGTPHYYVYNGQGDVVRLISASGATEAMYTYDAWGKPLSVTDASGNTVSDASHIANVNPIRYRGYYYDRETGFYYVSSRYYDPEVGRFLNADNIAYLGAGSNLIGYNLFAYCGNNPVTGYDPAGTLDWGNLFKGSGWLAVGVTAIAVGVSVLTCGVAAPAIMAVAAVTVAAGAATAVNGVSELGEAATGHNFMRDDVFRGNAKAYNTYAHTTAAVAEIGTMVCGGWLKANAPRIEAYNNVQNYTYADGAAKHVGERSYYDSTLLKKEIIKYGTMTNEGGGVYTFRAAGTAFSNVRQTFQSGIWELTTINGKGLIGHFLLRS